MRLISVVGARPQFVKIAPVCRAIAAHNARGGRPIEDLIVHTGQHYDPGMSDVFFDELQIPRATFHLGVGSGSHGVQTARMLEGIEALLLEHRPDAVVVYGDTNSTLAGALAAVKLHLPVVHVEAGLRSFNRGMPEEINRVATDHVSDLLLAPTPTAMRHLEAERLADRAVFTGDVMLDAVRHNLGLAAAGSRILPQLGLEAGTYGVVTLHRAENTTGTRLRTALDILNGVAASGLPLVFPVHPRTGNLLKAGIDGWQPHPGLKLVPAVGYLDMLWLVHHARLVLTDSGGLQKEALFLGTPCVTLREETEWVETVEAGGNIITGLDAARVMDAVGRFAAAPTMPRAEPPDLEAWFGDGRAADRIVAEIARVLSNRSPAT